MSSFDPSINVKSGVQEILSAAADALVSQLGPHVAAEDVDLQAFAAGIVNDAALAAAQNRPDLIPILEDQSLVLGEANRITVAAGQERAAMQTISSVLAVVVKVVIPIAIAAV